jgi:hypothetical protein
MTKPLHLSAVIFHCRFSELGPLGLEPHRYEESGQGTLPHLYLVGLLDDTGPAERMIAGLMVKTNVSNDGSDFLDAMAKVIESLPELSRGLPEYTSMLSLPVDTTDRLPSKRTAQHLFSELWHSHKAGQTMLQ